MACWRFVIGEGLRALNEADFATVAFDEISYLSELSLTSELETFGASWFAYSTNYLFAAIFADLYGLELTLALLRDLILFLRDVDEPVDD